MQNALIERRLRISNAILKLLSKTASRKEYLDVISKLISSLSGCQAVGIRILDEEEMIPYESYIGYSREFWERENLLSIRHDQCACIRVITGTPDPQDSEVTSQEGSFYSNNMIKFLEELSPDQKERFRGECVRCGFASVAVIPIRYRKKIIGAIHLADKREGMVPKDLVEFIEFLSNIIGEGINRFNLEDARRHAEERLLSAQKELLEAKRLSDLGTLSASVAHELRNPLSVISTAVYNIQRKRKDTAIDKHLYNIEKKILEANTIINSLLNYSRIKMPQCEKILIYDILNEMIQSVKEKFNDSKGVSIKKELGNIKDIMVEADPLQLKEVFYNILINSFQALEQKRGVIIIRGKVIGQNIELQFIDNGIGIEEKDLKKVFEPFFTTKSKGTGLGLSISREFIHLNRGKIEIKSEKGKGTALLITLPLTHSSIT